MTWADIKPLSQIIKPRKAAKEPYLGDPFSKSSNEYHLSPEIDLDMVYSSDVKIFKNNKIVVDYN